MAYRLRHRVALAAPLLAALVLAGCGNDPVSREVATWLPGEGGAAPPAPAEPAMVQPGADCRHTLGIPECYIYVGPPARAVPTTPVVPGAAQIHPGNGGGPAFVASMEPIPTGLYMTADGTLVPLDASLVARPLPPGTQAANLPPLPASAGPSPPDARTPGKPAPKPVATRAPVPPPPPGVPAGTPAAQPPAQPPAMTLGQGGAPNPLSPALTP